MLSECDNDPCRETLKFKAQIVVTTCVGKVKKDREVNVFCHVSRTPCRISAIIAKIDKKTGEVVQICPDSL